MTKSVTVLCIASIIFVNSHFVRAQDDCCGLGSIFTNIVQSGIFGGYGVQQFSAKGLNNFINQTPGFQDNFDEFGTALGWRVGANILGFRQKDWLFALKFYYQAVQQTQSAEGTYQGEAATQDLKLELTNWNLGLSISYILNPNFDIRIIDLLVTWTNAKFTNEIQSVNAPDQQEFKSPETNTGITVDAGFVWYPFPPYLALEVIGGYSSFKVDNVALEDGTTLQSSSDFIDGGGFFAFAVLTLGIPFN